jgi:hypothetical protein
MKTPIEELIAFVEKFGGVKLSDHEKSYFRMKERLEQQMAYNAGYDYAVKKVQDKIKWTDES